MSNEGYYNQGQNQGSNQWPNQGPNQGPPQQWGPQQPYAPQQQWGPQPPQPAYPHPQQGYGQQYSQQPKHGRQSRRTAPLQDVSVSVWPPCAAAVSAKKAVKPALIVLSAAKDAAKYEINNTTPTGLRARTYIQLKCDGSL
ncbi:hypothetical protein ONS96_007309 [Cadophora gregata f. sp. sojae]|nr:hypothetical protein ONS96_007309 [Cadophora gregata f. sp. sojae]